MTNLYDAMLFAMEKHRWQVRSYTGEPYYAHLAEVAGVLAMTQHNSEQNLQIAWLHDTIEDTDTSYQEILDTFGLHVASGVYHLTDHEEGNRKTRKALARQRLALAPAEIQTIKLSDGLSNLKSIMQHDKKFAKTYVQEWKDLLNVMDKGDPYLYSMLCREVRQSENYLESLE